MTDNKNSFIETQIFIEYLLEYTRIVIARVKSSIIPKCGGIITLNNKLYRKLYRILNVKYDYELWQLTGNYHYSVNISQQI